MYEYPDEYAEDKKCRICGYADKDNINIFSRVPMICFGRNYGNLFEKITTVFPMVLYESDPLPKNICKKCINNVSNMYNDIQKVVRQQQRWIENVRSIQPENKYLGVLNTIETSLSDTKLQIQLNYNVGIRDETLQKLLLKPDIQDHHTSEEEKKLIKPQLNDNFVKNIKSKLELNGCTVKKVKLNFNPSTSTSNISSQDNLNTFNDEPPYNEQQHHLTQITTCQYCPLKFEDLKELALHQTDHLVLSVDKIFQKHILSTHLRRGRLITIDGKKSIRCLNCWRIFENQSAILAHWYRGDCDYYCLICDKEFPQAPKLLREHTMEAHGVSYRSAKRQFVLAHNNKIYSTTVNEPKIMPSPSKPNSALSKLHANVIARAFHKAKNHTAKASKHSPSPTVCPICHASFSNWRSRNSHMRKHKPSVKYGDVVLPPDSSRDKYGSSNVLPSRQLSNMQASNQMKFTFRLLKNGVIPSQSKKFIQQQFNTTTTTTTTTISSISDTVIKSEPTDNYDSDRPRHTQIDHVNVENVIKSELIENDNQLLSGLAQADDDDQWHCFTCNATFYNVHEFERHTMFAHNPNFDFDS